MRPIAGLAATTLTVLTLVFAGAGPALATDGTSTGSTTSTTTGTDSPDHGDGTSATQGSADGPQPESRADQNQGGANGQCPGGSYCSTRDGSPSMNGQGKGEATGRPCAGCVGKADNKNPKGQQPNATDGNAGYECDTNQGIGRSNPAHTGCTTGVSGRFAARSTRYVVRKRCSDERTLTARDESCAPCPAHATATRTRQACGKQRVLVGTSSGDPRPAVVLGVQASRPLQGSAAAQSPDRSGVAAVAAAVLPDALLPSTGAGALLELLLVAGVVMVLTGAAVLAARRRAARA